MISTSEFEFDADSILCCRLPNCKQWIAEISREVENAKVDFQYSHQIGDRWENAYLPVESVPSVKMPMRLARDLVLEKWKIKTAILFTSLAGLSLSHPPFWFNIAEIGEKTGVHDHAKLASVSGVVYLKSEPLAGDLFFRKGGITDLCINPEVGKMVLFPSYLKHGVHVNKSRQKRVSLAFNLFPFPFPSVEW